MLANIIYKFSTFADYSRINYTPENMTKLLNVYANKDLLPGVIMQPSEDGMSQRIQLSNTDRTLIVSVLRERIDVERYSDKREGFNKAEISILRDELGLMIQKIYSLFGNTLPDAYRLAWNVSYAYFDISAETKEAFRNKFLKSFSFYTDHSTDEFIAQYAATLPRDIENRAEIINVLTTMGRLFRDASVGFPVDGYKIDIDVNTHQDNRKNRFVETSIPEFISVAYDIQQNLIGEVMNGCIV